MAAQSGGADTVTVSRRAVQLATALVTAGLLWVGSIFWQLNLEFVRHDERLERLEDFGPNSGDRFTARDGKEHDRRIDQLENWQRQHTRWGREKVGEWHVLHKEHIRRLNRLESAVSGSK